ncbi:MAG: hypothetical protein ACRD50_02430 [Candidatus Acidiferrales bacterium]
MNHAVIGTVLQLVLAGTALGQKQLLCDTSGPHPLYSKRASTIEKGELRSPDGQKILKVTRIPDISDRTEGQLHFIVKARSKQYSADLAGFAAEVTWSPDSSAFAVTQTEGGGGIGYRVYIFYIEPNELRKLVVSDLIVRAFGTPVKCEVPVPPNTGFVAWLGGSNRVLIAAEVVPVSICECSGMFRVYEVRLSDLRIVKSFDQSHAKKKFADVLGCELINAKECPPASSH